MITRYSTNRETVTWPIAFALMILAGASSSAPPKSPATIVSFVANPATVSVGGSSTLSWSTAGASKVLVNPGSVWSTAPSGSVTVAPATNTTYTLTAYGPTGPVTSKVAVTATLGITTTTCPGGTQSHVYVGCSLHAVGGRPPYTYGVVADPPDAKTITLPTLPEGMELDPRTGRISAAMIGGQGTYVVTLSVTDAAGDKAVQPVTFAINGDNAFLSEIFPANSIFHHRIDAAATGLPVDTSPAASLQTAYVTARLSHLFGAHYNNFPWGIPALAVPYNQPLLPVGYDPSIKQTYQTYFSNAPIPAYAPVQGTATQKGTDQHVLVYHKAGGGQPPALYELWSGSYKDGGWLDASNAYWPNVNSYALTPPGKGTADAAGLPESVVLLNADEVIGSGTPMAPNGVVRHPTLFTINLTLNNYVWPGTTSASAFANDQSRLCSKGGSLISAYTRLSQSAPPDTCNWSGPSGQIYRLKASVPTPDCAATSPQSAIIITGLRNYGIILGDNGQPNGGIAGTPDARWNDTDLLCLFSLFLSDFEPVNVSSLMVSPDSAATTR